MVKIKIPRPPSLGNIALLLATIVVMMLLVEFALKLVAPQKCYAYPKGLVVYDKELCYRLSPTYDGRIKTAEFDIEVSTNSHGLRDKEYSYEKPEDTIRIIGLGDSFQFGVGVEEKDTYLNIIEKELNEDNANKAKNGAKKVEVINAGIMGYGTLQELEYFNSEGKKYAPNIVILSLYHNDVLDNLMTLQSCNRFVRNGYLVDNFTATQRTASFKVKLFLNQKSDLYCLAKNSVLKVLPGIRSAAIEANLSEETILAYSGKAGPTDKAQQGLNITFEQIKELKAAAEEENAELVIVIIPDQLQVDEEVWKKVATKHGLNTEDYDLNNFNDMINEFAKKEDIKTIDLLPSFVEKSKKEKLYYPIEAHFNIEGHKVAAEVLKEQLLPILNALSAGG